jgi:hypothetical protein
MMALMRPAIRATLPYLCVALFLIGIANFFWFFVESLSLGGDALNGYVRGGHYYVASHGSYTEVSAAAWNWSRVHALSLFVTHPLAIGSGFVFVFTGGPLYLAGLRGTTDQRRERADRVLAGEFLAAESVRVQVGGMPLQRSTTLVVTSRGLVARVGRETITVFPQEIRDVTPGSSFTRPTLSIGHDGIEIPSPLIVTVDRASTLAAAIAQARDGHASAPPIPGDHEPPNAVRRRQTHPIAVLMGLAGMVVTGVLVGLGVAQAIPQLGLFGWIWTALALAIGILNARRWWRTLNG